MTLSRRKGYPQKAPRPRPPAILPDGRAVLAWVDRFGSRSIRARLATAADAPFDAATEVELYRQTAGGSPAAAGHEDTGELLAETGLRIMSLGQDNAGELYLLSQRSGIFRMTAGP